MLPRACAGRCASTRVAEKVAAIATRSCCRPCHQILPVCSTEGLCSPTLPFPSRMAISLGSALCLPCQLASTKWSWFWSRRHSGMPTRKRTCQRISCRWPRSQWRGLRVGAPSGNLWRLRGMSSQDLRTLRVAPLSSYLASPRDTLASAGWAAPSWKRGVQTLQSVHARRASGACLVRPSLPRTVAAHGQSWNPGLTFSMARTCSARSRSHTSTRTAASAGTRQGPCSWIQTMASTSAWARMGMRCLGCHWRWSCATVRTCPPSRSSLSGVLLKVLRSRSVQTTGASPLGQIAAAASVRWKSPQLVWQGCRRSSATLRQSSLRRWCRFTSLSAAAWIGARQGPCLSTTALQPSQRWSLPWEACWV
mmetsp:Transcript_145742/g.379070  ORF Transcript_145742/g.379070 Transcript_145742/m.379070 type:complete len:365 (+) Transcript_145742:2-1096(+)